MKDDIILGCDIGTGSCKIIAWQISRGVIREVQSFYEVQHPQTGYAEQDPEVIKSAFIECAKKIMRNLPGPPVAMGFSSAMHSLILLDKENKVIHPMLTWEDNRSHAIAENLRNSKYGKYLYVHTGTPIHSMSPLCKIAWFRENKKQIFSKTAKFIGIKEYLWHWMFGIFETDYSIASATGIFNIRNLRWDNKALDFCKIEAGQLPDAVKTTTIRTNPSREFSQTTGLPATMQFCIGASDGCMANVGSGVHGNGKAVLTIGTSGAIRITSPQPIVDSKTMIFNYLLDDKVFVSGGPINNGGTTLLWLFKVLLNIGEPQQSDFDNLESMLTTIAPGSEGLICIPWFLGERAPVWDEMAKGVWFGLTYKHNRVHLIKAAMEGVCFTLRVILESLEKNSGSINTLSIGGGFTKSAQWVQMMADITHKKLIIQQSGDASATGAALWTLQTLTGKSQHIKSTSKRIINPQKKHTAIYDKQFRVFRELYELTKKQMHILQS